MIWLVERVNEIGYRDLFADDLEYGLRGNIANVQEGEIGKLACKR